MSFIALIASVFLLGWIVVTVMRIGKREPGLPPGPPTLPLLGNLAVFPTQFAHYKFSEWAKEFGHIYSLKMGPGTAVVLTGVSAVRELMDRRSANTVDRPPMHLADLVAGGYNMVLARYTDNWRLLRKTAHIILTPQGANKHLPIQKAEATQVLYDLLKSPDQFYTHLRRYSNSVIMSVLFGKRSPRYETRAATGFFEAQHRWEKILEPGAHPPVDLLPFLKYIPERWASWKTDCKIARKLQRDLYFGLLDECEENMKHGQENGCYMEDILRNMESLGMSRETAGYLGGVLIEGGSDTTSSFLQSLVLALVAFPDAQRKAQEEIDRVVGTDRMPTLEDFPNLPYTQAVLQESHRFRPVAPMAIPHATLETEEYEGYIIPKGTTIFINTWGIMHDPEIFDEPETFTPERYLLTEYGTKPGVDASDFRDNFGFGAGRRVCPGIHLANNSLMLNTMNLLWAFNFKQAVKSDGTPVPVDTWNYESGILTAPRSFVCDITPRSKARAEIIEREFFDAVETFSLFERGLDEADRKWLLETRRR